MPTERGNGVPKAVQIPWGLRVADESTIGVNPRRRRVLHHRGAATRNWALLSLLTLDRITRPRSVSWYLVRSGRTETSTRRIIPMSAKRCPD